MRRKTRESGRCGTVRVTALIPFLALVTFALHFLPLEMTLVGSPVIVPVLCALAGAMLIWPTGQSSASSEAPEPLGPGVRPDPAGDRRTASLSAEVSQTQAPGVRPAPLGGPPIVAHSPSRRTSHAFPPVS